MLSCAQGARAARRAGGPAPPSREDGLGDRAPRSGAPRTVGDMERIPALAPNTRRQPATSGSASLFTCSLIKGAVLHEEQRSAGWHSLA